MPQLSDVSDDQPVPSQPVEPIRPATEILDTVPMLTPCTVTLTDPDDGALDRICTLMPASSAEITCVSLPAARPAVTPTLLLLSHVAPARHVRHVSDTQCDPSQPVPPTRPAPVTPLSFIKTPVMVTLLDPVVAWFIPITPLRPSTSTDPPPEMLPTKLDDEMVTRMLSAVACPREHAKDVSDAHNVHSHALSPTPPLELQSILPVPDPYTLTLMDPVTAPLIPCKPLTSAMSPDTADVWLPTIDPAVTESRPLTEACTPDRQRADESDIQVVPSHADPAPTFVPGVIEASPIPDPIRLMLTDPVPALLLRPKTLTAPASAENEVDALPWWPPAVKRSRCDAINRCPSRHATAVSDTHQLRSQALEPVRTDTENELIPKPCPCTVTLALPVLAAFDRALSLSAAESAEWLPVTLPASRPTVCSSLMLRSDACPALHVRLVSASHDVLSLDDDCGLAAGLCANIPSPSPCKVKMLDPVTPRLLTCKLLAADRPNDKSEVKLPTFIPPVKTKMELPLTPSSTSDSIALSDTHAVDSHPVIPALADIENRPVPMLPPASVTLVEPVPAPFGDLTRLNQIASPEKALVTLPKITFAVISSFLLPFTPHPGLHTSEVSDLQVLASHAVSILAAPELLVRPMPAPWMVTEAEPVAPPFLATKTLTTLKSADTLTDIDPATSPPDSTTALLPATPLPHRHSTLLSAIHPLVSHAVEPTDSDAVNLARPT